MVDWDWFELLKILLAGGILTLITNLVNSFINRKKSKADYADTLFNAAKMIDDKRDKYIEELQKKLEEEEKKSSELAVKLHELELAVERLKSIIDLNARYKAFFNMIEHPAFVMDTETGIVVDANYRSQDVFGFTRDEMIGGECCKFIMGEYKDIFKKKITQIKSMLVKNREGLLFPVHMRISYFNEGDKSLSVVILILQNRISTENRIMDFLLSILQEKKADYVTLWSLHNGLHTDDGTPVYKISAKYQVVSSGKKYIAGEFQDLPESMFKNEISIIKENRFIVFQTTDKDHSHVVELLKKNKISSMIMAGIFERDELIGILSVSSCKKREFKEEVDYVLQKSSALLLQDTLKRKSP